MKNINDKEKLAYEFAKKAHGSQTQGPRPYIEHPEQVVGVLKEHGFGNDENLILAGWLHDTIEDTDVTFEMVEEAFGTDVAELVDYVSQRPGSNRKERIKATYPHTRKSSRAVALKLSDRIANVRYSVNPNETNRSFFLMYAKEHPGFTEGLFLPGEHVKLWETLNWEVKNG